MPRRSALVLLAALTSLSLSACGAIGAARAASPVAARQPSAFEVAFQSALSSMQRTGAAGASTARVLRAHPAELARAIGAAMAQTPYRTVLYGAPALSLVHELPQALAVPVVEDAVRQYGIAPYAFTLPQAFLLQEIRTGPPWAAAAALDAALQEDLSDPPFALQALAALPAGDAADAATTGSLSPAMFTRILADTQISDAVKQAVLAGQYIGPASDVAALQQVARTATDPALAEQALVDLAESGAAGSVQALADFTDLHHTYPGIVWPASLMTEVKQADPHGYIAQGMDAVSALTGTAYVDVHRCLPHTTQCGFWLEGQQQYDPAKLAQWQSLLGRLRQHPGSDDIAYVIGREEEIDHRYGDAVLAFYEALSLPDGGMQYAAASRLVWVLDVEMTSEEIGRLVPKAPAGLRPLLRYAQAVHLLREGHLAAAVAGLRTAAPQAQAIAAALPGISYAATPFLRYFIPWQLRAAQHLQALSKGSSTPEGAFRLAQYTFQNPMLYYLGLWQGTRAAYIAFASGGTYPTPAWMRYQAQFNNYAVAARLYAKAAQTAGGDRSLRATDLYGEGESLIELMTYGSGTDLYPPYEIYRKASGLLRAAAAADPGASVGGRALMSLFYLTGQRTLLAEVAKEYPGTGAAQDARLREEPAYRYTASPLHGAQPVDFQTLWTSNRLSAAEQRAMRAASGTTGVLVGQETLLAVAAKLPKGEEPTIVSVEETAPDHLLVQWSTYAPADLPGLQPVYFQGHAYARVFGAFRAVRFQRVAAPRY